MYKFRILKQNHTANENYMSSDTAACLITTGYLNKGVHSMILIVDKMNEELNIIKNELEDSKKQNRNER